MLGNTGAAERLAASQERLRLHGVSWVHTSSWIAWSYSPVISRRVQKKVEFVLRLRGLDWNSSTLLILSQGCTTYSLPNYRNNFQGIRWFYRTMNVKNLNNVFLTTHLYDVFQISLHNTTYREMEQNASIHNTRQRLNFRVQFCRMNVFRKGVMSMGINA
jgi:hypothetical protein